MTVVRFECNVSHSKHKLSGVLLGCFGLAFVIVHGSPVFVPSPYFYRSERYDIKRKIRASVSQFLCYYNGMVVLPVKFLVHF